MKQYLSAYVRKFLTECLPFERGVSENTILSYRDSMKLFFAFYSEKISSKIDSLSCDQLNDTTVLQYLDWLEQERGCTARTRNIRLAALKSFADYIGRSLPEYLEKARKIKLISAKKYPHKTAEYLEKDEMSAIINAVDTRRPHGLRDKALLLFMYNTGCRVQELVDVELPDILLGKTQVVKITGKGRKQRTCPLWEETAEAITSYLKERSPANSDETHLFLNRTGVQLTRFGVGYILNKYSASASKKTTTLIKKKIRPHIVRHTTAMHLLQSGSELNMVRLWLGHASLSTTHMYIEINLEMKKSILEKCNPPELSNEKQEWQNSKILKWLDELSNSNAEKEDILCAVSS